MANTLSSLKSSSSTQLGKLADTAKKLSENKRVDTDDRFWTPEVDKAGNGSAILRFLPAPPGEDMPFVRYWDHGFKGPTGQWYIENSLTSIGKPDPLGEMNQKLWNTGTEDNQRIVRSRKRRLHYISNVYVISDPARPEREGKVPLQVWKEDLRQAQRQDEPGLCGRDAA